MGDWTPRDGPAIEPEWMRAAYSGPPGLVVRMLDQAHVYDGADVLDVATGSGYIVAGRTRDARSHTGSDGRGPLSAVRFEEIVQKFG